MNGRDERFKTADEADVAGTYVFDGYTDGSSEPPPTDNESVIQLDEGETFPPIRSARKGAWWRRQANAEARDNEPGTEGEDQGRDQKYEGSE